MMNAQVWGQMFLLFGYVIVGYSCNKLHIFDERTNGKLSGFLLRVAMPATILASAFSQDGMQGGVILRALLVTVGIYLLLPAVSKILARVFHWESTVELMLTYSNQIFMGLPIVRSMYGESSIIYVVIFVMVFNVWIYTSGILTLHGKMTETKSLVSKMINPGIVAALLSVFIIFLDLPAPGLAVDLLAGVGSVTTPLAMMVIGSNVAQVDLRQVLIRKDLYGIAVCKLIVFPMMVRGVSLLIMGPGMYTNVATVLAAMPTAGNVTMLCSEYDGNASLAAQGTCICTVLSAVTLPILLSLLG
ncbi:MAG: AEC family transporter [Lachnospiraceae bacterium]|nr:AEC family transporter [Lachnospiraceae bacterium]